MPLLIHYAGLRATISTISTISTFRSLFGSRQTRNHNNLRGGSRHSAMPDSAKTPILPSIFFPVLSTPEREHCVNSPLGSSPEMISGLDPHSSALTALQHLHLLGCSIAAGRAQAHKARARRQQGQRVPSGRVLAPAIRALPHLRTPNLSANYLTPMVAGAPPGAISMAAASAPLPYSSQLRLPRPLNCKCCGPQPPRSPPAPVCRPSMTQLTV